MKEEEAEAMDDLERDDEEWRDGWDMRSNDLQSKEKAIKRREFAVLRKLRELLNRRVEQHDRDTNEDA